MAIATKHWLWAGLAIANAPILTTLPSQAQSLIPDNTLGAESSRLRSTVNGGTLIELIEGGATRGSNLFHSFEAFGVDAEQQVYFSNPSGIEQIFSRVTGAGISQIDGTLGVLGAADLFVLNPNGVVFGPGARLDVAGSFTASTAGSVLFTDGSEFAAAPGVGDNLLSINVPVGLQLNAQPQGNISTDGQLEAGGNLTLLGNQLNLSGRLTSGKDLVLMGEGEIRAEAEFESGRDLRFLAAGGEPGAVVGANLVAERSPRMVAAGDVQFGDYVGTALKVEAGGSIEAGNIRTTGPDERLVADGSGSDEDLLASGRAAILRAGVGAVDGEPLGSITVESVDTSSRNGGNAGPILLSTNGDIVATGSFTGPNSFINVPIMLGALAFSNLGDAGNGGDISVSSVSGDITIRGPIVSNTYSFPTSYPALGNVGSGGDIFISSGSGNIVLEGVNSRALAPRGSSGSGGKIAISSNTGNISINYLMASAFDTYSSSDIRRGGEISITSSTGGITVERFISSVSTGRDRGNGGTISISSTSGNVLLEGRVQSYSGSSRVSGSDGGNISISSVSGDLFIKEGLNSTSTSYASSLGDGISHGRSGDIKISSVSGDLVIEGDLNSSSTSYYGGSGDAGDVYLSSESGKIRGNSRILSTSISLSDQETGKGGSVDLKANTISGFEVVTISGASESGNIIIRSQEEDLILKNIRLVASGQLEIPNPHGSGTIPLDLNDFGASGNVLIQSSRNINVENSEINSNTNGSPSAGRIIIRSSGQTTLKNTQVSSNSNQSGSAGEVLIEASRFNLANGGILSAETSSSGDGGNITINASESVTLGDEASLEKGEQRTQPVISVETRGSGQSGSVVVNTPKLVLSEASRITATSTEDSKDVTQGGNITLNVNQISLDNSAGIFAETTSQSSGGIVKLNPYQNNPNLDIFLKDKSRISASTFSSGSGGDIIFTAPESISITGEGEIASETSGSGRGGDVVFITSRLALAEGVRVSSTARLPAARIVNEVDTEKFFDTVNIDSGGKIDGFSEFRFTVPVQGEYITDLDLRFSASHSLNEDIFVELVSPQGNLATPIEGVGGDGKNFQDTLIDESATESIRDADSPFSGEFSSSNSRFNLNIFNGERPEGIWELTISDTVIIGSAEQNTGELFRVGDLAPWGRALGTQLLISSQTNKDVARTIQPIIPTPTLDKPNLGQGGTITIEVDEINLLNASLLAETEGFTRGGDIDVKANFLNLGQGKIAVRSTGSGNSGSINLNAQQATLLRNNSTIETDAGGNLGNGGNIDINTPFLISLPNENNDIIANAIGGDGGQINITANNIFNFEIQDGLSQSLLRNNTTNDISASSETGTSGTITLNTPNVDPAESLAELPSDIIDASSLIDNSLCSVDNKSEFLITGRGGLPTSPTDTLSAAAPWEDWDISELQTASTPLAQSPLPRASSSSTTLDSDSSRSHFLEAKHWSRTAKGQVVLHAAAPTERQLSTTSCRQLRHQLKAYDSTESRID